MTEITDADLDEWERELTNAEWTQSTQQVVSRLSEALRACRHESDRLKAINAELVLFAQQAEAVFKDMASGIKRSCWKEMYQKAHAALAKAKPA